MNKDNNQHAHPELRDAVDVTRFWNLVDRRSGNECWHWQGGVDRDGYGTFRFHGRTVRAPELALSFTTGELRAQGLDTCHSCDTPSCVNPAHLRFDTRHSNVQEMHERGRAPRGGRLTDDEVVTIRQRRAAGARQKDLAAQFGVSESLVSMIIRGIRWPQLGGPIETERKYINGR
jgi:hypothetical protein